MSPGPEHFREPFRDIPDVKVTYETGDGKTGGWTTTADGEHKDIHHDDPSPFGEKVVCPECTTLQHVNADGTLRRHQTGKKPWSTTNKCPRSGMPPGPMPTDSEIATKAYEVRILEKAAELRQNEATAANDRYGKAARELDKMLDNRALDAERLAEKRTT